MNSFSSSSNAFLWSEEGSKGKDSEGRNDLVTMKINGMVCISLEWERKNSRNWKVELQFVPCLTRQFTSYVRSHPQFLASLFQFNFRHFSISFTNKFPHCPKHVTLTANSSSLCLLSKYRPSNSFIEENKSDFRTSMPLILTFNLINESENLRTVHLVLFLLWARIKIRVWFDWKILSYFGYIHHLVWNA